MLIVFDISIMTSKTLSSIVLFIAVLLVVAQFIKDQVQKTEDDIKDQELTDSTAKLAIEQQKVIKLQDSLIEKHEELNLKLKKANKLLSDLSDYVTGGDNKPILSYFVRGREPLYNIAGQQIGEFYRVKLYMSNIGKTPIPNVTIKFHDVLVHTIAENGIMKEGAFDGGLTQKKDINLITRESIEQFYEFRIPSNFGSVTYQLVVGWNSDFYHVGAQFKINNEKNTVEITEIEYLDRDKNKITDVNEFIGYEVKNLKDYVWGEMFPKKK